jgi:predicted amidohydrolase
MDRLDQAASFRPDIAALPEVFVDGPPEAVPGPITEKLSDWARRNSSYVVFGIKARVADRVHNSAILLDRRGQVIGRFDKIHPTEKELEQGIQPGDTEPPVFETDFGRSVCRSASMSIGGRTGPGSSRKARRSSSFRRLIRRQSNFPRWPS